MNLFGRGLEADYPIICDQVFSLREVIELLQKRVQKQISMYAKCARVWKWNKEQSTLPV